MIQHLLLLVDGNLNERVVQERFFEAEGFSVATAATAEEALDKMAAGPLPVLVISSVCLQGSDGFALCECLRRQETTQEIPVILLSDQLLSAQTPVDQMVVKQKLKHLGIALEDYLPKAVDLGALLDRVIFHITLIGRAQLTRAILEGATHTGRLEYLGVIDLAQLFETSGLSGKVFFEMNGERAQLFFRDGQLIDARVGRLSEQKAFFRLLAATEGEFEIAFGEPGRPARIETPMQELIAEGQRRLNEIRWITMQLPPLDTMLAFDFELLSERLSEIPDEENSLLRLFDGKRTLGEVLALTDFDELQALGIVGNLFFDGLLVNAATEKVLPPLQLGEERPKAEAISQARAEETPLPEPALPQGFDHLLTQMTSAESSPQVAATPAELLFFEDPEAPATADLDAALAPERLPNRHLCPEGQFQSASGVQIGGAAADSMAAAPLGDGGAEEDAAPSEALSLKSDSAADQSLLAAEDQADDGDRDDCGFFAQAIESAAVDPAPAVLGGPSSVSQAQAPMAEPAASPATAGISSTTPSVAEMSDQELLAALQPSRKRPLMILGGAALLGIGLFAGHLLSERSAESTSGKGGARGTSSASAVPVPAQPPPSLPAVSSAAGAVASSKEHRAVPDAPQAPAADASAVSAMPSPGADETPSTAVPTDGTSGVDGVQAQRRAAGALQNPGPAARAASADRPSAPILPAVPDEAPPTAMPAPVLAKTSLSSTAPSTVETPTAASTSQPEPKASAAPKAAQAGVATAATEEDWEVAIAKGEALLDAERFSAAAKIFREAVKKRPGDQRALSGLGRALIDRNPNQAIRHLNQALRLDPTDALAWHDLGVAYQFSTPERPREAIHAYQQFLKYAPSSKKPNAQEIRMIVKTLREELGER